MTQYQTAKRDLKILAKLSYYEFKNDKPAIRQTINDSMDSIARDYNLTEYQRDLLANYACKLHP